MKFKKTGTIATATALRLYKKELPTFRTRSRRRRRLELMKYLTKKKEELSGQGGANLCMCITFSQ